MPQFSQKQQYSYIEWHKWQISSQAGAKAGNAFFKIGWPGKNVIQMGQILNFLSFWGKNTWIRSFACFDLRSWLRLYVTDGLQKL